MENSEIRKQVRTGYAKIAKNDSSCCGCGPSCCGGSAESISKGVGYSDEDMKAVPKGANLGLGCGNPIALASLKEGETVVDLGSGAGFDSFLAARRIGKSGRVIGVDMTPEMIDKARENALKGGFENVEFRLGEIENLPIADNSVDAIISNCVINLSPEKNRVFAEAFRVLKPGGRVMVSDIVLLKLIPSEIMNSIEMYVSCISGAALKSDYLGAIRKAGFQDVAVVDEATFGADYIESIMGTHSADSIVNYMSMSAESVQDTANSIVSAKVTAVKPR